MIRGLEEMNDDLNRAPKDRSGPVGLSFLEFREEDDEAGNLEHHPPQLARRSRSQVPELAERKSETSAIRGTEDDETRSGNDIVVQASRGKRSAATSTHDLRPNKTSTTHPVHH
jgi:hypothetical protein